MQGDAQQYLDFTVASAFERLVAGLETCLTTWRDGHELRTAIAQHVEQRQQQGGNAEPQVLLHAQLQHRLPFRSEPYTLTLHVPLPPCSAADAHPAAAAAASAAAAAAASPGKQPGGGGQAAAAGAALDLRDAPHRLQQWLGLRAFLLLTPDSYSGRVLDAEERHTLLSAAAVALSHARIAWPLLVPVHDAVRDGYAGVAAGAGGATQRFDSDSLHSSRLPTGLLQLDQLLLLFGRQLVGAGVPAAAAACRAAAGASIDEAPASMAAAAAGSLGGLAGGRPQVAAALRHSFALPSPGDESDAASAWGDLDRGGGSSGGEWDEQAAWRPWAAQADPVGCLELDVVWRLPSPTLLAALPPSQPAPADAHAWRLLALSDAYERDTGRRGFVLRPGTLDRPRRFLQLQSLAGQRAQRILGGARVAAAALPGDASFYGMLLRMAEGCRWAERAAALGDLASAEWWREQGAFLPPPPAAWVLGEAVRDIFALPPAMPAWPSGGGGHPAVAWPSTTAGQHESLGKSAPLGALVSRFALHALALGTPRAVAELWARFVSTLRLAYWEPLHPLPRMRLGRRHRQQQQQDGEPQQQASRAQQGGEAQPAEAGSGCCGGGPEPPDMGLSLLHQKLQLLDLCIDLQRQRRPQGSQSPAALDWESSWGDGGGEDGEAGGAAAGAPSPALSSGSGSGSSSYQSARGGSVSSLSPSRSFAKQEDGPCEGEAAGQEQQAAGWAEAPAGAEDDGGGSLASPPDEEPRGAVGVMPGATLHLHPDRPLRVPALQAPPAHTEDVLAEQQAAALAAPAGAPAGAGALRGQLQGRILLSDMQAFKAANPGCCLLDFVRWHSPKDCCRGADGGWELSGRMAAEGNTWRQLWDGAAAVPAARQRPLLDPRLEGERVLHFLETLPPPALFAELLAVGFSAAVQVLGAAGPAAQLPAVRRQLECLRAAAGPQLHSGVAAVLTGGGGGGSDDESGISSGAAGGGRQHQGDPPGGNGSGGSSARAVAGGPVRQPSWVRSLFSSGLSSGAFRRLLLLLGCAEATTVAGHSLLLRLSPQPEQGPADGSSGSGFAGATADALVAAALGEQAQPMDEAERQAAVAAAAAVDIAEHDRQQVAALLCQQQAWAADDEGGVAPPSAASSEAEEGWPEPFQREWLLLVRPGGSGGGGGGDAGAASAVPPVQRMYVKALAAEVRMATAIVAET